MKYQTKNKTLQQAETSRYALGYNKIANNCEWPYLFFFSNLIHFYIYKLQKLRKLVSNVKKFLVIFYLQ